MSDENYAARQVRVLVTPAKLSPAVEHEVIAQIDVGRAWHDRSLSVDERLAKLAPMLQTQQAAGRPAGIANRTWSRYPSSCE